MPSFLVGNDYKKTDSHHSMTLLHKGGCMPDSGLPNRLWQKECRARPLRLFFVLDAPVAGRLHILPIGQRHAGFLLPPVGLRQRQRTVKLRRPADRRMAFGQGIFFLLFHKNRTAFHPVLYEALQRLSRIKFCQGWLRAMRRPFKIRHI